MKPRDSRQRLVRRLTWTLGLALLPFACYGLVVPTSRMHRNGASFLVVEKFTAAVERDDWQAASKCYADAGRFQTELSALLGLPRHELPVCLELAQSADYYLPFSGEHEVYTYTLRRDRHTARMKIDAVATGQTWKIDSVLLSPKP